ncbi:hypothetical protein SROCM77S_01147 [Streptomyces rochei]
MRACGMPRPVRTALDHPVVERDAAEVADRDDSDLAEPVHQPALREFLDGPRRETQGAGFLNRLGKFVENHHRDSSEPQFTCEHKTGGTGSHDNDI